MTGITVGNSRSPACGQSLVLHGVKQDVFMVVGSEC